jgi:hypothetical protein
MRCACEGFGWRTQRDGEGDGDRRVGVPGGPSLRGVGARGPLRGGAGAEDEQRAGAPARGGARGGRRRQCGLCAGGLSRL